MTLAMKMLTLYFSIASAQLENDPFYDTVLERLLQELDEGTSDDVNVITEDEKIVAGSFDVNVDSDSFEANKEDYRSVFKKAIASMSGSEEADVTVTFSTDSSGARRLAELTVSYEIKVDDLAAAEALSTSMATKTKDDVSNAVTESAKNIEAVKAITVVSVVAPVVTDKSTSTNSTPTETETSKAIRHAGIVTSFASVYVLALVFLREHH